MANVYHLHITKLYRFCSHTNKEGTNLENSEKQSTICLHMYFVR